MLLLLRLRRLSTPCARLRLGQMCTFRTSCRLLLPSLPRPITRLSSAGAAHARAKGKGVLAMTSHVADGVSGTGMVGSGKTYTIVNATSVQVKNGQGRCGRILVSAVGGGGGGPRGPPRGSKFLVKAARAARGHLRLVKTPLPRLLGA